MEQKWIKVITFAVVDTAVIFNGSQGHTSFVSDAALRSWKCYAKPVPLVWHKIHAQINLA